MIQLHICVRKHYRVDKGRLEAIAFNFTRHEQFHHIIPTASLSVEYRSELHFIHTKNPLDLC